VGVGLLALHLFRDEPEPAAPSSETGEHDSDPAGGPTREPGGAA
jgi:hypothetical protein